MIRAGICQRGSPRPLKRRWDSSALQGHVFLHKWLYITLPPTFPAARTPLRISSFLWLLSAFTLSSLEEDCATDVLLAYNQDCREEPALKFSVFVFPV